jgi:hypothetical protein
VARHTGIGRTRAVRRGRRVPLSQFYNELNAGFEQLAQLRDLSERVLIPNLDRGADEFYDPSSGALREKYRWYRYGLERLGRLAAGITELGDNLAAELQPGATDGVKRQ